MNILLNMRYFIRNHKRLFIKQIFSLNFSEASAMFIKNTLEKPPICIICIVTLYSVIHQSMMYLKFQLKSQAVRTIQAVRYLKDLPNKEPQAKSTHYIRNNCISNKILSSYTNKRISNWQEISRVNYTTLHLAEYNQKQQLDNKVFLIDHVLIHRRGCYITMSDSI